MNQIQRPFKYLPNGKNKMTNGKIYWIKDGQHHREDGPAVIYPFGTLYWFYEGKRHRFDGPSYIPGKLEKDTQKWYIMDNRINVSEYKKWLEQNGIDIENLSEEDKTLIIMRWAIK